jgi:RecA-family ATPase
LLALCRRDAVSVVVIDTLSRVVKGEENSNDTYRNFYNHTGRLLKANAIAMVRLDHAGHSGNHSRGASAKADDVDLVYLLRKRADKDEQPGYRLERTHARIVAAEFIDLALNDEPVSIKSTAMRSWSEQAIKKARELDAVSVPIDATVRDATTMLRAAGIGPGKTGYLMEALRLRMARDDERKFGL